MRVCVHNLHGRAEQFEVEDACTLNHFESLTCERFGVDSNSNTICLVSGNVALAGGNASLLELGIQDGVVLQLVKRRRKRVLTASEDGTAKIWDASTGECKLTLAGHNGWVLSAVFSPDGTSVVTSSNDGTAKIRDAGCLINEHEFGPEQKRRRL